MNLVFPLVFLALMLLAPIMGADSRRSDPRGWWPGRAYDRRRN